MSYHDRRLLGQAAKLKAKKRMFRRSILKGAMSLTLFPKSPNIQFGSVEDDWRAVGKDIRKAMNSLEACD